MSHNLLLKQQKTRKVKILNVACVHAVRIHCNKSNKGTTSLFCLYKPLLADCIVTTTDKIRTFTSHKSHNELTAKLTCDGDYMSKQR